MMVMNKLSEYHGGQTLAKPEEGPRDGSSEEQPRNPALAEQVPDIRSLRGSLADHDLLNDLRHDHLAERW